MIRVFVELEAMLFILITQVYDETFQQTTNKDRFPERFKKNAEELKKYIKYENMTASYQDKQSVVLGDVKTQAC